MAGSQVTVGIPGEGRLDLAAHVGGVRAARMEHAPGRRVDRVGRLTRDDGALAGAVLHGDTMFAVIAIDLSGKLPDTYGDKTGTDPDATLTRLIVDILGLF